MGLLSKFKSYQAKRDQSKIAVAAKTAINPKAIKEERMGAIQFLASLDESDEAVKALLHRFEFSLEHGIVDTREKEAAMEGVVKHGLAALPVLSEWIRTSNRIAWPIKILKAIGSESDILQTLQSALNFGDISFDQAAIDKNYDILCYLRDFDLGDFAPKLEQLLRDQDERVRFSCVEVLIEQNHQKVPQMLESFIFDTSPENTRIRQSVLNAFVTKKWPVKEPQPTEERQLAHGYSVNTDGTLYRHS